VRSAVLLLLAEKPRHGYELIQEIAERSSGAWTPSPGSVYPTLQALEDEGLVKIERLEGRRVAALTEQGTAYVEEQRAALGEPWSSPEHDHASAIAVRRQLRALMDAVGQVARVGTPAQNAAAAEVLDGARRDLYRVLADGPSTDG
jgi:DNA-binding PadR family transcriptional regulator